MHNEDVESQKDRENRERKKRCNGPMGHSFRFSTSFPCIRCDRKFPPVIRRGEEEESVDRTRIGASAVTCENRERELSPSVVLHVLLPLFLPSIQSFGAFSTFLFAPFLFSHSFSLSSLSRTNVKINGKKKEEREKEREFSLLETLFYTSVRLTLNCNERRQLKTRSRVIGALMWF